MLRSICLSILLFFVSISAFGQARYPELPGYDKYQWMTRNRQSLVTQGTVSEIAWSQDGAALYYSLGDEKMQLALESGTVSPATEERKPVVESAAGGRGRRGRRGGPGRARQSVRELSPDEKWTAVYREFNVVLEPKDEGDPIPVTTSGTDHFRYGTACWVYGEELNQQSAMWWSPDSRKLVYYEIDERHMDNYYLTVGNSDLYTKLHTERYPKAGDPNPYAGLMVYDVADKTTTRIDVGGDRTQYIYNIRFTPDGSELLYNRTNRHQNRLEVMAADLETGRSRVVLEENQPEWQDNSPLMRFLADGHRFIWETERNGWRHYELRDLDGRRLNALSEVAEYPCVAIVDVDEESGYFYYTANSDRHPLNAQLHRTRLDGTDHRLLTNASMNHSSFRISPNDEYVVAQFQSIDAPPTTIVVNAAGKTIAELAKGDAGKAIEAGLTLPEMFSFKADDGETDIYGVLYKPRHFDPTKQYPLLISVYGGPSSGAAANRFSVGNPTCEYGYLVATIANRGTSNRGKKFETAGYLKLGIVDIQDQADGVKYLRERPYVDGKRVGIYGHSYGGYMSALAVLKFPDVFQVAVAGAPVTDWRNYDTIYTERYMRTPQENADGYRDGSCLTYADQLTGKLLIMHGLIDDNVHPSNTWQLIKQLQQKGKRFDLMVYPDDKHGLGTTYGALRWEFLHRNLIATE